ncbi:MAG TPA: condensation domain-containing protein, partial [Bryobacteraceae bacterium]|nr:condensation domain-containing protein [Bryobacteraceae bacterium]
DILRSVLRDGAERPEIEVLPGWLPAISVETWSDAAIERFFGLPLEPSAALPARVAIFRKTGDEHEVCLHQHHFFTDGISLSIFWKEVITRYLGAAVPGPGPTFEEYCRSVDRWLESESGRASRSYWRQKLRGAQPTRLPLDYPRTEPADFRGEHVGMRVESGVLAGIDEFCRRESVTRFSVLLWALARSVHQETGQDDVLVSTFQANRALPGFQRAFDVVGPVIEEQVLRCRIDAEKSPGEQLLETHETVTESMAHSSVPVMYLRESGECPIPPTAVSLVYQSFVSPGDLTAGPLKLRLREAIGFGKGHASFELELVLWPVGDELLGVAAFSTQVFRRSTVERILSRFYGALAEVS